MKRLVIVGLLLTIVVTALIGGVAQSEEPRYYQAETLQDINFESPYARQRPDIDRFKVFEEWVKQHTDASGNIIRETSIDFAAIVFIDTFLGNNDCNGLWHQVYLYGPIDDFLTLSKIRTVSMTSSKSMYDPDPTWCISEGEALLIRTWFVLENGTYNYKWPYLDE